MSLPSSNGRTSFWKQLDLPCLWDRRVWELADKLTEEERELMAELTLDEGRPVVDHHLLGHPQLIQNDMRGQCELATHGIYLGDPNLPETVKEKRLLEGAAEKWELLLQLDSDWDIPEWMWGGLGRLYFWIRRDDLDAGNFDRTWLILQC